MSDNENPFRAPEATATPSTDAVLTPRMIQLLREAAPWTRFLGIVGFITTGFIVLGAMVFLISGQALFSATAIPGASAFPAGIALLYLGLGAVSFFISRFTYRIGARIRTHTETNDPSTLEDAFGNLRSLVKTTGILTIVYLALIPVLLIVSVVIGLNAAGF